MKRFTHHSLIIVAFSLAATIALADRGGFGRKDKKRNFVDVVNAISFKYSILSNLRAGFVYTGSTTLSSTRSNSAIINNSVLSFKRGNTMYIMPYKNRVIIPEYNKTTGYKLIIRRK